MGDIELVGYDTTYFELSKEWLSDAETNALTATGPLPSDEQRQSWYESLHQRKDYLIFGVEYNKEPIGACGLKHINDNEAEYWGYIGRKDLWGKGLGKSLMEKTLLKAIDIGIQTINLIVIKNNQRAINLYRTMGFITNKEDETFYYMSKTI